MEFTFPRCPFFDISFVGLSTKAWAELQSLTFASYPDLSGQTCGTWLGLLSGEEFKMKRHGREHSSKHLPILREERTSELRQPAIWSSDPTLTAHALKQLPTVPPLKTNEGQEALLSCE